MAPGAKVGGAPWECGESGPPVLGDAAGRNPGVKKGPVAPVRELLGLRFGGAAELFLAPSHATIPTEFLKKSVKTH